MPNVIFGRAAVSSENFNSMFFTDYVQPICMVSNSVRLEDGNQVFVAGWGKTLSGTYLYLKCLIKSILDEIKYSVRWNCFTDLQDA